MCIFNKPNQRSKGSQHSLMLYISPQSFPPRRSSYRTFFFFFSRVHLVWPLKRCRFLVCVCVRCRWCVLERTSQRGAAPLPPRPSLPQIELEWKAVKNSEASTSARFDPSITTFLLRTRRALVFYSHTSRPMSSHLHPPACKWHRKRLLISNDVFSACVGIRNINGGDNL